MTELLTAFALILVIEGLTLAISPFLARVAPETLRYLGLAAASLGVFFVWLLRG